MLKKSTSLTLAFSGLVLLTTRIVLYLGPAGHVGHLARGRAWAFPVITGEPST